MATCPKCQLPNPDGVEACIWCGQHRFDPAETPLAAAGPGATVALPGAALATPVMHSTAPGSPLVASFLTPTTPPPDQKPLPSHLGILFARAAAGPGSTPVPSAIGQGPAPTQAGGTVLPSLLDSTIPVTPPPPPQVRPKLVVLRGQKINHEYPVYEGRNVIGRFADKPVDIDLVSQEAEGQIWSSRQHAVLTFDKNLLLVEDLNSLNGTWVNGVRLYPGQPRALKPSDVIQIGTVQMKVVLA